MAKVCRTLFIRNLPFSATKEKLEDVFSDFGPIKQCFIVTDKDSGKSKGFGYVSFSLVEDAITAKDKAKTIDGRRMAVDFADMTRKKSRQKKKFGAEDRSEFTDSEVSQTSPSKTQEFKHHPDRKPTVSEGKDNLGERNTEEQEESKNLPRRAGQAGQKKGNPKYHNAKILVVTGFTEAVTEQKVQQCLTKLNVKKAAEVKCPDPHIAHVKFKCIRDVKNAIRKLDTRSYQGATLKVVQLSKAEDVVLPQKSLKRSRLIIRNVSFKCGEDDIQKAFEPFGDITEVQIPRNKDGRMFGFAFVQFRSLPAAKKALDSMNSAPIRGRPVAVDWAIPQDKFINMSKEAQHKKVSFSSEDEGYGESPAVDDDNDDDDDDNEGSDESDEDDSEEDDKLVSSQKHKADSDEDDDGDESDNSDIDESEDDDNDDSDEDFDSEFGFEEESSSKKKRKMKEDTSQKPHRKSDVDQGRTIFIRNLSFDSTEEGMEEFFSQYGELNYCKIVMDPKTEHSRGMAFVQFKTKEGADICLSEAKENSMLLDGRQLIVSLAVSRENAAGFNEKKTEKKEKKDNRNLYLAREGMIRPGTQAAEGLSKTDLDKRMKVLQVKREKLKDVNVFISTVRLCVRNIPVSVDDKELKKVFLKAVGDKKARVTECRIMRDLARKNSEGIGKSMGYGFVAFSEHQHALQALRNTNNSPEIFGENKRLIVEFSLENRKALETKQRRLEKQKFKREAAQNKQSQGESPMKVPRKPGSGKGKNIPGLNLSEEDKKLKSENPTPKGLPSHWGPKIRHKARNTEEAKGKNKKGKKGQKPAAQTQMQVKAVKRQNTESISEGPKKSKRRKTAVIEDSFDKMVDKYKQKFKSGTSAKSKWYD